MTFTSQDMLKLQELMAENPENKALLEKLLASHQYTISQISHEVRNPLSLVYSTLQLIESAHPEVAGFKHWHHMKGDIEYITALLENLSKHNNGGQLSIEEFGFRAFMEHIVLSFASGLIDTDIEFASKIEHTLPAITADRIKLREVFLNLLQNAKEAIHDSGIITLKAFVEESRIIVTIQDTGCGIAKEDLENIFTPFVTNKQSGTGLGLAIVREIVHAHGGTITVRSSLGKGTIFTVVLPIQNNPQ